MKTIIVDAMGGDLAPEQIVLGAMDALADKDIRVALVGDRSKIEEILSREKFCDERLEIVDAKDVITNDESPTMAIKLKKESSLVKAFDALNERGDAFVSCGSTGAVLVGAFMKVGRIKGVSRPALAPVLPTLKENGRVVLCDCGANVDCKPQHLDHFAIMGSAYAKAMLGVESPRVGLLNNGAEQHKGNELAKEAYERLSRLQGINFVGNCEARDLLSGDFDVVVADGFDGNIALKSNEGAANAVVKLILDGVKRGGLRAKLGALLLKPVLKSVKKKMDYNAYGGACFLGVNKVVIKSHGASKRRSVAASIIQAKELAQKNVCESIRQSVEAYNSLAKAEGEEA